MSTVYTRQRSRKAKAWRVVKALDPLINLIADDEVFGRHEYQETQELMNSLLKARMAASNILLRLGDDTAFRSTPQVKLTVVYDTGEGENE